jgi:pentatricopeptide repeat protein
MEAHALHRDIAASEGVLDRLAAAGHHPTLCTYNRLLHGVSINGDLVAAMRVYARMRLQGLQPDIQTMRALFKCVRLYASNVRVATARKVAAQGPDRCVQVACNTGADAAARTLWRMGAPCKRVPAWPAPHIPL